MDKTKNNALRAFPYLHMLFKYYIERERKKKEKDTDTRKNISYATEYCCVLQNTVVLFYATGSLLYTKYR